MVSRALYFQDSAIKQNARIDDLDAGVLVTWLVCYSARISCNTMPVLPAMLVRRGRLKTV